jgi:hypothetical protein
MRALAERAWRHCDDLECFCALNAMGATRAAVGSANRTREQ